MTQPKGRKKEASGGGRPPAGPRPLTPGEASMRMAMMAICDTSASDEAAAALTGMTVANLRVICDQAGITMPSDRLRSETTVELGANDQGVTVAPPPPEAVQIRRPLFGEKRAKPARKKRRDHSPSTLRGQAIYLAGRMASMAWLCDLAAEQGLTITRGRWATRAQSQAWFVSVNPGATADDVIALMERLREWNFILCPKDNALAADVSTEQVHGERSAVLAAYLKLDPATRRPDMATLAALREQHSSLRIAHQEHLQAHRLEGVKD